MTIFELTLITIGLAAFIISYFIPNRNEADSEAGLARDEIRELVEEEFENSKDHLISLTDETINYSVEKAERSLDRITNDKMMALGEYSDTIMNEINNSHQEVVFLHDMLNNNKNDLTVMLGQALKDSKDANDYSNVAKGLSKKALEESQKALECAKKASGQAVVAEDTMIKARKTITDISEADTVNIEPEAGEEKNINKPAKDTKKTTRKTTTKKKTKKSEAVDEDTFIENDGQISLRFDEDVNSDNNAKVLALSRKGKSNVAIAKELGMGVGEVNLIINLAECEKSGNR